MESQNAATSVIRVLHYLYPISIFIFYASASLIAVCMTRKELPKSPPRNALHKVIFCLMFGVFMTYVVDSAFLLFINFEENVQPPSQDTVIGSILLSMAWLVLVAAFTGAPVPPRAPFTGSWILSTVMEVCILGLTATFENQSSEVRYTRLALGLVRLCTLFVLDGLALLFLWPTKSHICKGEAAQSLLGDPVSPLDSPVDTRVQGVVSYGSIDQSQESESFPENHVEQETELGNSNTDNNGAETEENDDNDGDYYDEDFEIPMDRLPKGNWWSYVKKFSLFVPMLWPVGHKTHQLRIWSCSLCLVAIRILNLLMPRQTGIVIDTLTKLAKEGSSNYSSWLWIEPILLLGLYNWLNSSSGLPFIRTCLWTPVENSSLQKLHIITYNHIMELSSDFHESKRSGKLWYSMYNGYSVVSFLELVLFEITPVLFDFVLAAVYIYFALDPYLALIVFGTSILYFWSTTAMVSRLNTLRRSGREMHKLEYEIMTETMSNWRTVSYFNRVPHEEGRYGTATRAAGAASVLLSIWVQIEQALKATVLELGQFLMLIVAGYRVVRGGPVGNIVVLLQLWNQIVQPLSVISESFTRIASNLIDAEDLLKILHMKSTIQDAENAKPLELRLGEVEFDSVNFSYDKKRTVLKNVSFRVSPGQTVALVGETGGGKSTILKLLFRFYDVISGSVKIDGQDIRKVTLKSLRDIIGNVPQDATLFNDTILNNVKYAKLEAKDEEIVEACKAAAIHDKIMTFSKRYQSKVGEGGTKLSGGELQRIAIARTILQNPQIVLLDEATSSVDTETEAQIQESLKRLTSGRTTFVIAHRLSTIVHADVILVVRNGEITEQGAHQKLMEMRGQYYNLWTKQMFPEPETGEKNDRDVAKEINYVNDLPESEILELKQSITNLSEDLAIRDGSGEGDRPDSSSVSVDAANSDGSTNAEDKGKRSATQSRT